MHSEAWEITRIWLHKFPPTLVIASLMALSMTCGDNKGEESEVNLSLEKRRDVFSPKHSNVGIFLSSPIPKSVIKYYC